MISTEIHGSGESFFVDAKSKDEINELRMQEYAKAQGFVVDLNTLKWKESDDESFILAAKSQGRILSTMRAEFIDSSELLAAKLECPWDFPKPLSFPVMLLSRAATLSTHRALGLNLVLRYWFFKFALFYGVRHVVGTFISGSPRERTLEELGYELFENKLGWQQSTYRSLHTVKVALLDLQEKQSQALNYCESVAKLQLDEFPFRGPFPQMKNVTRI